MPVPAHIQAATLEKFLATWKDQAVEEMVALWSDNFTQQLLPLSLGTPLHSRAEAAAVYPKLTASLTNWKLEIKEVVHDAARGTAAVYATSLADTPFPGQQWTNEYAVFLSFTEDGTQIRRLEEMVNTAFYRDFFPKFQRHLKEQGGSHA